MINPRRAAAVALPIALLAACSGQGQQTPQTPPAASDPIMVQASDTECALSRTEADAGTITFDITNKGGKVTEFYLYGEGNRIVGEVENIGPGLSRRLVVEVPAAGKYTTACKPGMTGDGIRGDFNVKGTATT